MQLSLNDELNGLYGPQIAATTLPRLLAVIDRSRARIPKAFSTGRSALTERDVLLISYADQLRARDGPPLQVLAGFLRDRVRGLVSTVHLLPFYPSSSDDGFSVVDYFQVDHAIGSWADLSTLQEDFDLMFDGVFNHMSAQSPWFQRFLAADSEFRDFFVTVKANTDLRQVVRPRALPVLTEFSSASGPINVWTTFSADQVDLNYRNPEVLLKIVEALLFYVAAGALFIRLDAIAFIWKEIGTTCLHHENTHRLVRLFRAILDQVAPNILLITETNVPHTDNISYFGNGSDEAQLVYNFALPPLVLYSFIKADTVALSEWASVISTPSSGTTFLNFLASHDGIGVNSARALIGDSAVGLLVERTLAHGGFVSEKYLSDGSCAAYELNINYFDALSDPRAGESEALQVARFICAHAIMLSLPGMPALYFHSLFGSRGDRAAAEASGIPRRINRQKPLAAELTAELTNELTLRARVYHGLSLLLRTRRNHPAFRPSTSSRVKEIDPRLFVIERGGEDPGAVALCVHNVSSDVVRLQQCAIPNNARVFRVAAPAFMGPYASAPEELEPFEARWFLSPREGQR
jgi:sucrose phosphorylase